MLEARGGTEVDEVCANSSVDYLPACVTNFQSGVRALLLPTVCWTNGGVLTSRDLS